MRIKRKRNKNYPVTVTHEDFLRMNRADTGLNPSEIEAAAILFAALRNLHALMGAGGGQRAFDVIANSLPQVYAENWIRGRVHSPQNRKMAA